MAPKRTFPRNTLEDALRVPLALKEKNGGNSWVTEEVAKALGLARTNNKFFYLTAASRDYQLTTGTRDAAEISLAPLGREAVYPPNSEAEHDAKIKAFLSIEPFQVVLDHYGGNKLPEKDYVANTLSAEFGIDESFHDDFIALFAENCRYLGIGATFEPGLSKTTSTTTDTSITVAKATSDTSNGDSPICFVIMPFTARQDDHPPGFFEEVLRCVLAPAASDAGFEVRTAHRQGSDVIQSTILNDLLDADLVLADLTEHNPNVLFELGMRMAEEKPVVLVRAKGTGPIFDVDNMLRVVEYDPNVWPSTVERDVPVIRDHIKAGWDTRNSSSSYLAILRNRV